MCIRDRSETEGAHFWLNIMTDLSNRGVKDILIASIDNLTGFEEAIRTIFPKTEIQLCIVHQIRNSLKYIASKDQKLFLQELKLVYKACLLYTSDAADERSSVDLGGRRIIKKKNIQKTTRE